MRHAGGHSVSRCAATSVAFPEGKSGTVMSGDEGHVSAVAQFALHALPK
jgi:hypothetical protein